MAKEFEKVDFILKNSSRAKRIRIIVHVDGKVVVIKPKRSNQQEAERFVFSKMNWIKKKIFFFKSLKLKRIIEGAPVDLAKNRESARELVTQRLAHFGQFYGVFPKKFSIRNQKTRWGSCSKKQNLNFNFRIIFLPQELADYLITHELCHLKEFNHSARFWELVALAIPDYKELRKRLKKEGVLT
jgi:predicted metal-dependent hydrolase